MSDTENLYLAAVRSRLWGAVCPIIYDCYTVYGMWIAVGPIQQTIWDPCIEESVYLRRQWDICGVRCTRGDLRDRDCYLGWFHLDFSKDVWVFYGYPVPHTKFWDALNWADQFNARSELPPFEPTCQIIGWPAYRALCGRRLEKIRWEKALGEPA
jgi:hypothetical protein